MDEDSKNILRYIKGNKTWFTELCLGNGPHDENHEDGIFNSSNGSDFAQLGQYIATNSYVTNLEVNFHHISANITTNRGFYNGIKSNSSITSLKLRCNGLVRSSDVRAINEILQVYQENNNLTRLDITFYHFNSASLNGGEDNITTALRRCTNLKYVNLNFCGISDEHLHPIAEAVRQQPSLEYLSLPANLIGNTGCQALAILLEDPNCNLHTLQLPANSNIDMIGFNILANSLANNTKLKKLNLNNNPIDQNMMGETFCNLLCNTSSVNSTFLSNHTLERIVFHMDLGELKHLLECNRYMKEYAAINKILRYHPNIDMEPLFELGTEDKERNLKGLPYVLDWFERAKEAVLDISFIKNGVVQGRETFSNEDARIPLVDTRKLSAVYQFALAMPLLFVPASHAKACDKKRKRG